MGFPIEFKSEIEFNFETKNNFIFGVTYNKTHLNDLLNSGFVPQGDKAFVDSVYLYAGRVPPNEDTE